MKGRKTVLPKKKYAALVQFLYCLPCIVFIAVVILIVRGNLSLNLTYDEFWSFEDEYSWDLFSWWKSRIVVLSTIAAFCILLWRIFTGSVKIKKTIFYIPMAVYAAAVILSFAFSQHKDIAWSGFINRFEGTYILICYMFMLFYTINTIENKQTLLIVVYAVIVSQLLLQIIGIAELIGKSPLNTVIGQKIVLPNYADQVDGYTMWQVIDALAKETPPRSIIGTRYDEIAQTVYSSNYVSFYLSVVIPVFVMLFILCSGVKQRIAIAAMLILAFINIWASNSSGGFLGLFVAFIAAVFTFRKFIFKWRYQLLIIIGIAGVSFVLTDWYMKHTVRLGLVRQVSDQVVEVVSVTETKDKIDYFINNNDSIVVSVNNNQLNIMVNYNESYLIENVIDSQDKQVDFEFSNAIVVLNGNANTALAMTFMDDRFGNLVILIPVLTEYPGNPKICIIKLKEDDNKAWLFLVGQNGTYYQTARGALVKLRKVPHWGFTNNMSFGTYRGYIWSRTFPLMLDTLFLGHGADTFAIYFPQDDFTGKYYDVNNEYGIVGKPHNFILLNFVNTGGISAIALIAIFVIYIIQGFRLYSKSIRYDIFSRIGAGIYLGIIAFFAAGISNDSSVSIMPLIYGLLGIGISCNYFVRANLDAD
jgi:hypothetical protein